LLVVALFVLQFAFMICVGCWEDQSLALFLFNNH
jgi:hypothetical protein